MANYSNKAPGVYIQDVSNGVQSISQASSSVGLMIGTTRSGSIGIAQKVKSWAEFLNKYSRGLDTPFTKDSYLPYAVYGFFSNGGSELYIGSIKKNAKAAEATSENNGIKVVASNEGVWGNSITVSIVRNSDYAADSYEAYDITVAVGTSDSVVINDVLVDNLSSIMSNSKVKSWLSEFSLPAVPETFEEETITLSGGSDGDELVDADYVEALKMADSLSDLTLVAIPGQCSKDVDAALLSYCDEHDLFPMIDMPIGSTVDEAKKYRKEINAWTGALFYPWGKMNDPLTNSLKVVPAVGHMMGLYARTIESQGIHKAPAGVSANVRGFVELETVLSSQDVGELNGVGVVCIMSRSNSGIVSWGARSLNSVDSDMKYVTDGLINLNLKKSLYAGTEFAVFEPNTDLLRASVVSACTGLLETMRKNGTLKGTKEEAYFVTCDGTNNTDETIAEGFLYIDIGYAPVKPAEFVIIRLAHTIVTSS